MRWLQRINPFKPKASTLDKPDQWLIDAICAGLTSATGVQVTPLKAMGVSTVFACVNRISSSLSSVPLKIYRRDGDKIEEAVDHPLYPYLHDAPNDEMSIVDFIRTVETNRSLRNNAYVLIMRNGLGEQVLYPVAHTDIVPRRDSGGALVYDVLGTTYPKDRIIHLRGMSFNGIQGVDTVGTARDVIGLAVALQDNAARFFGNGSRPGAVLEHPASLSKEAAARLAESFDAAHSGKKAYSTAVLEEGLKYIVDRQSNIDSQMIESRNKQDIAICQLFSMPPHKVGLLDKATFSNIEQQSIEYVVDCLMPIARTYEAAFAQRLLSFEERKTLYFKFQLDGLLRGDLASRYLAYATARQWGWLSVNEIRGLEERNPVKDGDIYLQPSNMQEAGSDPVDAQASIPAPPDKQSDPAAQLRLLVNKS